MRLVTFRAGDEWHLGTVNDGRVLDLTRAADRLPDRGWSKSAEDFLSGGSPARTAAEALIRDSRKDDLLDLANLRLGAPLRRPGKIVAVGLNYAEHVNEYGSKGFADPVLFAKFPNSITGPYDDIVIPPGDPDVDYEAELAVVIGRHCRGVPAANALQHVGGYTALNDVSARKWQFGDAQWT